MNNIGFMCGGGSPSSCFYFTSWSCAFCEETVDFHRAREFVKKTDKGLCKCDRQLDPLEFVFSEEVNVCAHKICRSRHINPKAVKTLYFQSPVLTTGTTNLGLVEIICFFS